MTGKMNISRLVQDELTYELQIRGIGIGTVGKMRKYLARAIRIEKEGAALPSIPYPFTFDDDEAAIQVKIAQIESGIADIDRPQGSKKYSKLEAQLNHVLGRINLCRPQTEEEHKQKADLLAKVLELMTDLENKCEEIEKSQQTTPAEVSVLANQTFPGLSITEGSDEEGEVIAVAPALPAATTVSNKIIPVHKWGLEFSGEKKGLSLNAFLERVDELAAARHVNKEDLFQSLMDLFLGKVLI